MQQSDTNVLLTDLCAICHINPIKYTCPRCGIHTCSLPCVKRHKSWAQCSGIRDPAAYRKRADLATPASVDQDFNFITSVERSLQRADDLTSNKGIDLVPSGLKHNRKSKFEEAIGERQIRVIKAPKGLSRNKQNKSHWAGAGNGLMWTTEWIHYDGRQKFVISPESKTVEEASYLAFGKQSGKRAIHHKKRKRSDAEINPAPAVLDNDTSPQPILEDGTSRQNVMEGSDGTQNAEIGLASSHSGIAVDQSSNTQPTQMQHQETGQSTQKLHYYLFKPNTTSKVKCLIPVAADSKVVDALRGRTLLEFPTFYIRQEAPDALPEPFVAEEKYDKLYGTDVVVDLPNFAPGQELEDGEVIDLQSIDENKVLEVLQKDLNG